MKKLFIILLLILIFKASFTGQSGLEEKTSYYFYDTSFNEKGIPIYSTTKNPSGIILDSSFFNKINGKLFEKVIFEYNGISLHKYEDKGDSYEYTYRDYKGDLKNEIVYKSTIQNKDNLILPSSGCDDCPKNTKPRPCKEKGKIKKKIIYKYDDRGNIIEFSTNSSCVESYIPSKYTSNFKYNTKGKLIEVKEIWYDSITPNTFNKITFKYDEKEYLIEEVNDYKFYPLKKLDKFQKYIYNIDEENKLIERAEYDINNKLKKKDFISKGNYMYRVRLISLESYLKNK